MSLTDWVTHIIRFWFWLSINQSNYFIVRLKVDQRAGQLSLPHLGITKTEKIELKHKTDEQISPVNSLEPWDQSDRQKQTKVEDKLLKNIFRPQRLNNRSNRFSCLHSTVECTHLFVTLTYLFGYAQHAQCNSVTAASLVERVDWY